METKTDAILFLNALVSNMDIGVIAYDIKGFITLINNKATEFLGIKKKADELSGMELLTLFEIPELSKNIRNGIKKPRRNFHLPSIYYQERHLLIDGKKLLNGMLLSISDISESVIAKDEATQSLILGQEIERRRLAKEIHDGLGPNMSALKLQIDAVKRKAESKIIISELLEINETISSIASDIRQISHDLMPSSLIDFGVITALTNFSKKISLASDIEVHFQSNIDDGELTKEYKLNIYRIIQELVNNAIKHSECNQIEISIRKDGDILNILVQDDGIGMDIAESETGIGIFNIQTRVESLHGDIFINSKENTGVTVHVTFPSLQQT